MITNKINLLHISGKTITFKIPSIETGISFSDSRYYCVLYADMVSSTRTTLLIADSKKLRTFYCTFINSLLEVARRYDSKVIKIVGDSIICYFPKTMDYNDKSSFDKALQCGLEMLDFRFDINTKLNAEKLEPISYRISADYGRHEVVTASPSALPSPYTCNVCDLMSPTMNICSKINSLAKPDTMIIGSELYEVVRNSPYFTFRGAGEYTTGIGLPYPVYSVSRI